MTDNGDPTNMVSFSSHQRKAFSGLCLAIVRSKTNNPGNITITAKSPGLKDARVKLTSTTHGFPIGIIRAYQKGMHEE
jgi:beta-galactosidase